jgi:NAD+ kinase
MKTFCVYGDDGEDIENEFLELGYEVDRDKPDFVISYGGDGTLLRSEFAYQGVPKLFIKNTKIGKLAQNKDNQFVISEFVKGNYLIKEYNKIECNINNSVMILGSMEITLHNKDPRSAVRYNVYIDGEGLHHELIGDGVIVCNTLGSTGYYRSITDSYFEVGIGLAFNNSTEQADHVVLANDRKIEIEITRGPGIVFADNQEIITDVEEGDRLYIKESKEIMKLIRVNNESTI